MQGASPGHFGEVWISETPAYLSRPEFGTGPIYLPNRSGRRAPRCMLVRGTKMLSEVSCFFNVYSPIWPAAEERQ